MTTHLPPEQGLGVPLLKGNEDLDACWGREASWVQCTECSGRACAHRGSRAVDRSRGRTAAMTLATTCSEPGSPQALHVDIVTLAMTPNL